jgi:hypothetical protein
MSDDQTWSMKDLELVWSEGNSSESLTEAPVNELAKAVKKPAHHNSKVKAALLLLGGTCMAALGTLVFSLTSGKTPKKDVATAPDVTQPVAASQDGWETAAKQSASDAGAGINIPSTQNPDEEKPPASTATTQPTTKPVAITTVSTPQPTTPAANSSVAKPTTPVASPVVKASPITYAPVTPVAPKPIAYTPVTAKPITYAPINSPVAPKPIALVKPEPKPITSLPPVAKVAPKPITSLPPVAKVAPKPITYAPTNLPVASTPAPIILAKPEPKIPISKPITATPPKVITPPLVASAPTKPVTSPVVIAARPTTPTNPTPVAAPISWEQASAAGIYGDSSVTAQPIGGLGVVGIKDSSKDAAKQQLSNYEGALSPTLLLPAGANAKGHTVAPYVAGAGKESSSTLSIALDEAIELASGYSFPVGTIIKFDVSVRDNGSVGAISKNAAIGGVEIQIPDGAISLASADNSLLMTKEISTGGDELTRADIASSIWGAAAGAGKAILQGGNTTTTNTGLLGTTTTQANNGNPNVVGGIIDGAFSPLATNGQQRAQQTAARIQQRSRLNTIDVGTKVKLFVNAPVQIQIPVNGQQVSQTPEEDELPPPRLITSNSTQLTTSEKSLQLPVQKALVTEQSPAPQVQPTSTPLSPNPPKTRISRPW